MSSLSTLPKGDSAWLLRKSIQRIMQQVSVLETNIGSSTTGNSANTQVIFNDAGTLRGDAGLTYNKATDTLTTGSATITGALTVNGGVNLANATAINFGGLLTIYSDTAAGLFIRGRTTGGTTFQTQDGTNPLLNITNAGVFSWYDGAGGTRMTLNATGLGLGVTPSAKLHVEGTGPQARFSIASASDARHEYYRNGIREGLLFWDANVIGLYATQSSGEVVIASANTIRVRVKAGGQVRFVPLASDPASAEAGDVYYNSSSNKLKCYNGTTWNDLF